MIPRDRCGGPVPFSCHSTLRSRFGLETRSRRMSRECRPRLRWEPLHRSQLHEGRDDFAGECFGGAGEHLPPVRSIRVAKSPHGSGFRCSATRAGMSESASRRDVIESMFPIMLVSLVWAAFERCGRIILETALGMPSRRFRASPCATASAMAAMALRRMHALDFPAKRQGRRLPMTRGSKYG